MPRKPAEAVGQPSHDSLPTGAPTAEQLAPAVEAILLSADRPVSASRLAESLGLALPDGEETPPAARPFSSPILRPSQFEPLLAAAIAALNTAYESTGRSFRIEPVAGGYRVMTLPAFAPVLAAFHRARNAARLSKPAVETLAIIAYKQPITRAELEAIRGVACGEVLKTLMDRRLVTIKGRAEELGRPILYGTTRQFLDHFGLPSLADLPTIAELKPQDTGR